MSVSLSHEFYDTANQTHKQSRSGTNHCLEVNLDDYVVLTFIMLIMFKMYKMFIMLIMFIMFIMFIMSVIYRAYLVRTK